MVQINLSMTFTESNYSSEYRSKRQRTLIESLTFENPNAECKKDIRPLRVRSAPLYEWIKTTVDIESNAYNSIVARQKIMVMFDTSFANYRNNLPRFNRQ